MSKLRKVQFFRNSNLTAYANHAAAVNAAELAWKAQGFANMEDGELLLYRYTITGEENAPAHTIVGVVRNDGTNKYFEVLANYDMLTSQFDSLDVTGYEQAYVTSTANGSSFTVQGIQETNGLIGVDSTQSVTINIDGTYDDNNNKIATQSTVANAIEGLNGSAVIASVSNDVVTIKTGVTEADGIISNDSGTDIVLEEVAVTGAAEDVSYDNTDSGLTATDVQAAIDEVQGNIETVQGNLETVDASIKDGKIQHNNTNVFSANTDTNLALRSDDFVYDSTNHTLGVNVQTETSPTNKIATMLDIASLSGAMHYKGAIDTVGTSAPSTGDYYTAVIDGNTYYLHVAGTSGTATAITPKAGDTLIISGTSGITQLETGDMVVYGGNTAASANVINTNITLGMGAGQVAANHTALTATEIVVAGPPDSIGVQTTGFTFDAEDTDGRTTIGSSSTNATVPTSKNVYDAIQGLAVNSVSEAVVVTNGSDSATVTDTLTVDGTAAAGQAFTIAGGDGVNVAANESTITVAADVAQYAHEGDTTTVSTASASNLLKIDASGKLSVSDTWDCGVYS